MKNFLRGLLVALLAVTFTGCKKYDDTKLWDYVHELKKDLIAHEQQCKEMNTNISALQTVVAAVECRDYITNVLPIYSEGKTIGYTISFAKSGSVTIYHGQDGQNGKDGVSPQLKIENGYWYISNDKGLTWAMVGKATGGDMSTAVSSTIGVMKDTDGITYWTINGEWLLDENGEKVRTTGKDGSNGAPGITPQLKIVDGYWYLSTDKGVSWAKMGKATGDNGGNGTTPTIGVLKDTDNQYYWTVNGEWLLDANGNKIRTTGNDGQSVAGKDGVTPQLKIEEGYWYVSTDKGITWTVLGKATGENGQDGLDGETVFTNVSLEDHKVVFVLSDGSKLTINTAGIESNTEDGHEYVDLDLPSGTLWATCNIGADKPEDGGLYFAWGETVGYTAEQVSERRFYWTTYAWCEGTEKTLTKYNKSAEYGVVDGKTELDPEDDAAHVLWGGKWHMPTKEQIDELSGSLNYYVTSEKTYYHGKSGTRFISKSNGNSIFIPHSGYLRNNSVEDGTNLCSSSLKSNTSVYCLHFGGNGGTWYNNRYLGYTIRPVFEPNK